MAVIPHYASKGDKGQVFVQDFYRDSEPEVDALFRQLESEEADRYYYRGMSSGRYKLLTSGQRFIIENDIPWHTDGDPFWFYSSVLDKTRKAHGGVIKKWMDFANVHYNNHIALFSYIQHHGGPTPFLDFTRDPFVALYFATEAGPLKERENELDEYFSLYRFPRDLYTKLNQAWVDAQQRTNSEPAGMLDLAWWWQSKILAIDDETINEGFKIGGSVANNLNVINQQGLFLTNLHRDMPLAELILDHERNVMRAPYYELGVPSKRFKCDNIHYGMLEYVRKKLTNRTPAITSDFIYPSPKQIFATVRKDILDERRDQQNANPANTS